MMRYEEIERALEDISRSRALARALDTPQNKEYIEHLDRLEAALLRQKRKAKAPDLTIYEKWNQKRKEKNKPVLLKRTRRKKKWPTFTN